jgi:hypothetical protein
MVTLSQVEEDPILRLTPGKNTRPYLNSKTKRAGIEVFTPFGVNQGIKPQTHL